MIRKQIAAEDIVDVLEEVKKELGGLDMHTIHIKNLQADKECVEYREVIRIINKHLYRTVAGEI